MGAGPDPAPGGLLDWRDSQHFDRWQDRPCALCEHHAERLLRALRAPRTRSPRSAQNLHSGPRPDALPGQRQKALPTA
ncbi:hypothetical protein [Streptomyces sp. NPDC051364]|uniref:hypothetical protein n=1 Tax=Streptomyces sp. NPDC051364 TaxID=3155799 RepID=UPI00343971DF